MKVKLVHGGGGGGGGMRKLAVKVSSLLGWDFSATGPGRNLVMMALLGWDFSATGPGGNLVMIDPHTSL